MTETPMTVEVELERAYRMAKAKKLIPHSYEPPIAYHYHNTPCKECGKTARHSIHRRGVGVAPSDVK